MSEHEQNEFNASRGLATVNEQTVEIPVPRRPFAGLRKTAKQQKQEARMQAYPFCGTTVIEVAPGVYDEAGKQPLLLQTDPVKDANGRMVACVLEIMVDC